MGGQKSFNKNWFLYAGRLSAQLEHLSLREPSITSYPAGVRQSGPDCVLACSFQWGNGHSHSLSLNGKPAGSCTVQAVLGLAEEGTFKMDLPVSLKPDGEVM